MMTQNRTAFLKSVIIFAALSFASSESESKEVGHTNQQSQLGGDQSTTLVLTADEITRRTGRGWTGIVYVCAPYCSFKSLVQEGRFSPSLSPERIEIKQLKLISSRDPLYPLLIQEFPVLPHLNRAVDSQVSKKNEAGKESVEQKIPPYAESNFDFGYSLEPGLGLFKGITSNSNQVQSDWDYSGVPRIYGAELHLMRGRSVRLFGQYFQFVLSGSYWTTSKISMATVNSSATFTSNQYRFMVLLALPKAKLGASVFSHTRRYRTENESLTLYAMESGQSGIGVHALFKNGVSTDLYYPLQLKLKETQAFRVPPFKQTAINLHTKYCHNELSGFDMNFKLCGFFDYYYSREQSQLNQEVSSGGKVLRTEHLFQLGIQMRFGDELWR